MACEGCTYRRRAQPHRGSPTLQEREEKAEQGSEPVGGGRSLLWEEARGWRRSKACKIPVTHPTWRWRSGRLPSANAPRPRYLAGILRYGFPSPSPLVERGGGARESGNAGGCPPLQQVRKKMSYVAAPPHFPEEFGGPHRSGEGTLPGGRDGRARASLTVSINQGGQPPDRCCLSLSVTVQLQPSS
jgi:hypothetical protein